MGTIPSISAPDSSLAISGKAANAKVVSDKIDKIALEGDSTGYMSFNNNNKILTVPQSYGFSYTVIFKL